MLPVRHDRLCHSSLLGLPVRYVGSASQHVGHSSQSQLVLPVKPGTNFSQEGQHVIGDAYDHVVVMFSDIVGFSTMSSTMSAVEVFLMLTNLYYAFDRLVDKFGVYKVETIGDGYMIAAGTDYAVHCSLLLLLHLCRAVPQQFHLGMPLA